MNENEKLNEQLIERTLSEQRLSEQMSRVQAENEEIKLEKDDSDKMRLEAIKKHDVLVKALNQNLATLRGEIKVSA